MPLVKLHRQFVFAKFTFNVLDQIVALYLLFTLAERAQQSDLSIRTLIAAVASAYDNFHNSLQPLFHQSGLSS